jgi:hypothetical protein
MGNIMIHRLIATGMVSAAIAALAPSAQAATTDDLRNAAGQTNGCRSQVSLRTGPQGRVIIGLKVDCPSSADVHRISGMIKIDRVEPDGSLLTLAPWESFGSLSSSREPLTSFESRSTTPCSTYGLTGAARLRVTARGATMTTVDHTDPDPYVARVSIARDVAC